MSLKQSLNRQRRQLELLANAWLAAGATSYAVLDMDNQVVRQWPISAEICPTPHICAPIKRRREQFGYLRITGIDDAVSNQRLVAEAQLIAQFVQFAHDLGQLTQEVVDRQDELVAMVELTRSTRNQLDLEELIESILQQATRLFGCDGSFVVVDQVTGFSQRFYQHPASSITDETLTVWRDKVYENYDKTPWLMVNSDSTKVSLPPGVQNVLMVPLTIRGTRSAAIGVFNKRAEQFNIPNRKLLTAIAQQVTAQFENALLHAESIQQAKRKHEYALAREVQMHLLPEHAPFIPHLEVAAHSRPAREVGGDFFDYLPSDEGELYFSVGDVSGKGMPAAMLMGMSHATLANAARFLDEPTPAAIIDRANTALYDDFTDVSMFATVFVGHYDGAFRTITFANAGHSPVIHCPAGGEAVMLVADGTALGILPWSLSEDHCMVLEDGDLLIVASDGYPEARDINGEMYGYDRLMRLIEANRNESAQGLLDVLCKTIKDFSDGTEQDDDETIMVLKGIA